MEGSNRASIGQGPDRVFTDPDREAFLQTVVQSFPEPAFVIDAGGTIRMWNALMENFIGYTADEVLGRDADDVFQTEGESKTLAEEIVEQGTEIREKQIRTAENKAGETFHTRAKGFPLQNDQGNIVGAIEILGRVTELVEAKQQVTSLQQELSTKVETGVNELQAAASEIADSAAEMSTEIDGQVDSMKEVSNEVSTFSATVEEIASSAEEVSSQSTQAREYAETSETKGEALQERMEEVETTVDSLAAGRRRSRTALRKSTRSSRSSTTSPTRPTCSPSTRTSKPPGPINPETGSRS